MRSSAEQRIVVLGAGLTGMSCALELGRDALIFEREATAGGLARSYDRSGFRFDFTGHWLHFADHATESFTRELMDGGLVRIERRASIHSCGITTPYPFQANTFGRPPAVVSACVLGFFRSRERAAAGTLQPAGSFADYIHNRLGDGIARHFMEPYNTKLWTVSPAEMDPGWCERFVPTPTPEQVVWGALVPGGAGEGLGYNASFWYPREGGIGRLAERLRQRLAGDVRTGVELAKVDWRARVATTAGGDRFPYHALVSTAPLPDLVRMLVDPPEAIVHAAEQLVATSVTYWDVAFARRNRPGDAHWTYYPDPEVPFYRAGSPSAVLPDLAPAGRSLYAEVSHRRGTPVPVAKSDVLAALRAVGLAGADEEPLVLEQATIDCAYVIMDHAYGAARGAVLDWLASEHMLSVGRYGGWTYDSMEGALREGRQAALKVRELA